MGNKRIRDDEATPPVEGYAVTFADNNKAILVRTKYEPQVHKAWIHEDELIKDLHGVPFVNKREWWGPR